MTSNTHENRAAGGEAPSLPARAGASRGKTASAMVYLQEELGDARLRCDQVLRYIQKAAQLVEKSTHKDHFFEVAGDVIRGLPESAFKLHKALEAVALAANRIDYEEIKQDLRPEKVEELERVLQDVRVRQVQRRSLPMVNPANVAQQLKALAKRAREDGRLDTEALGTLIASLESGTPRVAEDGTAKAAAELDAIAHALEHPPSGGAPSRRRVAQVLRKVYGEQVRIAGALSKMTPSMASEDAKRSRFEEGKPADPTKNMDPEDAKAWKENTDEYGDKFKKEAGDSDAKRSRFEEGKPADPTKNMDPEDAKAWKENTDEYGDKFKKEAGIDGNLPLLKRLVESAEDAARELKHSVGLLAKDARRFAPQLDNVRAAVASLGSIIRAVDREVFDDRTAATKAAGGQNIPAPPDNVIDEIMSWHGGQGSKLYSVGSRWFGGHDVDADDAEAAYDELERLRADPDALADFEDHLMENGVTPDAVRERVEKMQKRELQEMQKLLREKGFNPQDAKKLQGEGMGPEELKTRLRVAPGAMGSLEYTHNLKRKSKKAGDETFWKTE